MYATIPWSGKIGKNVRFVAHQLVVFRKIMVAGLQGLGAGPSKMNGGSNYLLRM